MNSKEIESLKKELLADEGLGLSADQIIEQIKIFEKGIPFLKLSKPCTIGDGAKIITESEQKNYIKTYLEALDEGRVIKFVPASGAATRMFKKQLAVLNKHTRIDLKSIRELAGSGDEECKATLEFIENIQRFAFYNELKKVVEQNRKSLEDLIKSENVSEIIRLVAENIGLNYANLPKGSILFHSYPDESRTAF
ncbi:MAG: DUF4301 family protein, partial [Ignavibacteriaceae bacterium]|nr:DUF4301 family protein [Ignavibacteriaceae bacterium]